MYFSNRYVIFTIHFFFFSFWQVSHLSGSIIVHMQMCRKFQAYRVPYQYQHCTIILGLSCNFSDNWGGTGLHKYKRSYPMTHIRKSWSFLILCRFDCSVSTTKFKCWKVSPLSNDVLSWLSCIRLRARKCNQGWTLIFHSTTIYFKHIYLTAIGKQFTTIRPSCGG